MKKIYLSPSDQIHNAYAYGNTNEAAQCRKIAKACKTALERCGFEAKTNFTDGSNAMYERINESNAWGADMHICIHSNAGGGKGVEVYVSEKDKEHMAAAQPIYDAIKAISPFGSSRGIKTAGYAEIRNTNGLCVYIETDFHDNKDIAKWIVSNTTAIGETICKGVCKYYGVEYVEDKPAETIIDKPVTMNTIEMPTLKLGDKGAEVKTLRRLLRQLQYTGADGKLLKVTDVFDEECKAAVKRFQGNRGSKLRDGIVGIWTWTKLLKG